MQMTRNTGYTLNQSELESHLAEQLQFLEASADGFDKGFEAEAKRLAVTIRVLLHETASSHSLLGQLGQLNVDFLDTCLPDQPGNLFAHGGLVFQMVGPKGVRWSAQLSDVPYTAMKPFADWWDAPVFRDDLGSVLSRRELVLTMANKDGGAHIDPALSTTYARLSKQNSMGVEWVEGGVKRPATGPEQTAVRQIAHEVLTTLKPGYTRAPPVIEGIVASMSALTVGPPPLSHSPEELCRLITEKPKGKRARRRERGKASNLTDRGQL